MVENTTSPIYVADVTVVKPIDVNNIKKQAATDHSAQDVDQSEHIDKPENMNQSERGNGTNN